MASKTVIRPIIFDHTLHVATKVKAFVASCDHGLCDDHGHWFDFLRKHNAVSSLLVTK